MPFDELRKRSLIDERANAVGSGTYSERIRNGLPDRPPAVN